MNNRDLTETQRKILLIFEAKEKYIILTVKQLSDELKISAIGTQSACFALERKQFLQRISPKNRWDSTGWCLSKR